MAEPLHKVTVFLRADQLRMLDNESVKQRDEARKVKSAGGEAEVNVNRSWILRQLIDTCLKEE